MAVSTVAGLSKGAVVVEIPLVALAAGRGIVAVTDIAVVGAVVVDMLLMQCTARAALEVGVTLDTTVVLWRHRTRGWRAGDVAALTVVVGDGVMEDVSSAATVAEVMPVHRVALGAGRRIVAVTDIAVAGTVVVGM